MPHRVSIHYDFTGAIDNIYDSLVVRLALSGEFGSPRFWEGRVEYYSPDEGIYGLKRIGGRRGVAQLDLYFSEGTRRDRRDVFVSFIESHLRHEGVTLQRAPESCVRMRIRLCGGTAA